MFYWSGLNFSEERKPPKEWKENLLNGGKYFIKFISGYGINIETYEELIQLNIKNK